MNGATSEFPPMVFRSLIIFVSAFLVSLIVFLGIVAEILSLVRDSRFQGTVAVVLVAIATGLLYLTLYCAYLLCHVRRPVIVVDGHVLKLVGVTTPWRVSEIDLREIADVYATWDPTTVPKYVVMELRHAPHWQHGQAWSHVRGNRVFYECSNLTRNPDQIAKLIGGLVEKKKETGE